MKRLESLNVQKFAPLINDEMQMINGGSIWSTWKEEVKIDTDCGLKTVQRCYNWFGLHGTSETQMVND